MTGPAVGAAEQTGGAGVAWVASQEPPAPEALAARLDDGKAAMLAVVTDDLRERGIRADEVVRRVAAVAGGRGGGKPHMAQAGIPDAARIPDALGAVPGVVSSLLGGGR